MYLPRLTLALCALQRGECGAHPREAAILPQHGQRVEQRRRGGAARYRDTYRPEELARLDAEVRRERAIGRLQRRHAPIADAFGGGDGLLQRCPRALRVHPLLHQRCSVVRQTLLEEERQHLRRVRELLQPLALQRNDRGEIGPVNRTSARGEAARLAVDPWRDGVRKLVVAHASDVDAVEPVQLLVIEHGGAAQDAFEREMLDELVSR